MEKVTQLTESIDVQRMRLRSGQITQNYSNIYVASRKWILDISFVRRNTSFLEIQIFSGDFLMIFGIFFTIRFLLLTLVYLKINSYLQKNMLQSIKILKRYIKSPLYNKIVHIKMCYSFRRTKQNALIIHKLDLFIHKQDITMEK